MKRFILNRFHLQFKFLKGIFPELLTRFRFVSLEDSELPIMTVETNLFSG